MFLMPKSFSLALEDAREELAYATHQAKNLNLRISQLEAVIAQLEALIASGAPAPTPLFDSVKEPVAATQPPALESSVPLWKAIVAALNGDKSDFTVPQALKALERTGRHISSPNRLNIIRNTIIHKEDVFARLGEGHYCVRGFENADKEDSK